MTDQSARDDDLRLDLAIDRYWEAVKDGQLAALTPTDPDLDKRLAATIRRVHALAGQPLPDLNRVEQLRRELMLSPSPALQPRIVPDVFRPTNSNGHLPRPIIGAQTQTRRVARRVSAGLSFVATVALIALALAAIFYVYDNQQRVAFPPLQETPANRATPVPDSTVGAWPLFRGNPERNGAMPGPGLTGPPTILWQYSAGAPARIAPAVAEGMVFLSPDSPEVFALDAKTGEVRWSAPSAGGPLAVADGLVYTLSEDVTSLVGYDTVTAEERWRVTPGNGYWSPLVVGDTIYYGGDPNLLVAYDATTAAVRWQSEQLGFASRSVALGNGVLVVGTEDRIVYGIDQATGATRWSFDVGGAGTIQTPAILGETVYIGYFGDASNAFFALDLQTGEQRWRMDGVNGEGFWAPGAAGDLVFVPTDGGRLLALDAATGETRWSFTARGPMKSAPAIIDGVVYAAGDGGILVGLDAATGTEQWRFQLDGAVTFGPILVDGVLYVSTANGILYALGDSSALTASPRSDSPTPVTTALATPSETPAAFQVEFVWTARGSDQARLAQPLIPRLAPDGSLWVSDSSGRFFIFDLDGNLIETWGSAGSDPGQFQFVQGGDYAGGFVFADDGTLFVADTFNQRIQHFDRNRNLIGTFGGNGTGNGQFLAPMQIAIGPDGTLAVVDAFRNDVQRFNQDGTFLNRFDGSGTPGGQLNWPNGIAVAADGSIWVGDFYNLSVRQFSPDGQEIGELDASAATPSGFSETNDLFIDADGFIYVAVQAHRAIKVFDANGRYVGQWGDFGSDDGQFSRPVGIVVNKGGAAYVTDGRNSTVQKFRIVGPLTPVASGTPTT